MFCNQTCEVLKKDMLNVTREINALVDAVVASGLGDEEGFIGNLLH